MVRLGVDGGYDTEQMQDELAAELCSTSSMGLTSHEIEDWCHTDRFARDARGRLDVLDDSSKGTEQELARVLNLDLVRGRNLDETREEIEQAKQQAVGCGETGEFDVLENDDEFGQSLRAGSSTRGSSAEEEKDERGQLRLRWNCGMERTYPIEVRPRFGPLAACDGPVKEERTSPRKAVTVSVSALVRRTQARTSGATR